MSNATIALLLLVPYAIADQWAFRCQRVGRGLLLLAKDSAANHPRLFSNLMPGRFVAAVWIARLLWISGAAFAWRAWGWLGLIGVLMYVFVLGAIVDGISPWPSYRNLLRAIRQRIESGAAGFEGISLLPYVDEIERRMAEGVHFEKATAGEWVARAARAGAMAQRESGKGEPPNPAAQADS